MAVAGTLEIQLLANIARLQKDMDDAKRSVGGAMAAIEKSTAQASAAMNQMGSVVKGLVGSFSALQLMVMADQFTKYTAQLKLATTGLTEYANAVNSVRQISKAAQTDIAATGTLFARITNGTRELGLGQARVIDITEAVTLALKVSGATAQESASAMLQLSQAFGSGVLRGEEFNAVNEAAPRLMKALADGIGQPVGALRELAKQGLITSEVMANALPKALGDLRQEATQVQTISGAFVVLKNNLVEFVGTQAQASGSVSVLTGLIGLLAENLGLLASAAIGLASAKIAQTITGMAIATGTAVTASMTHRAATLAAAQAQAEATATTAALTAARVAELRSAVLMAEGNVALAITTNGLVPAQARAAAAATAHTAALATLTAAQRASSVVSSALTGALGLLGGPIGAITTALGIGVAAWMAWGSASETGEYRATAAIEKSTPEILEDLNRQIAKLKERNALATAGLPDVARGAGEPAERLASLQRQITDLQAGRGINGGQPLPEAARVDLLQKLLSQYGQLAEAIQSVTAEQKKLDSTGKAATDLLDVRQRLLGINKAYLEDLGKYQAALKAGAITEAEYIKEVSLLATETYRKSDAGRDATKSFKGLNKESDEQAKLLAELSGLSGSFAEDWARLNTIYAESKGAFTVDQLTAAQANLLAQQPAMKKMADERKQESKLLAELSGLSGSFAEDWARLNTIYAESKGAFTVDQLIAAQANLLAQQPAMKKMADERKQEWEIGVLRNKQVQERAEREAKVIKSAEEMLAQAQFELSIMGLSNVERDKAIALRQLEATGIDKSTLKYAELAEAISKAVSDRAAMQKQIDDFQNVWNSIDRTAQQTFTNIFEGGQDAFSKLRDTLKATLLDLLYQMTVKKWVFNLAANVTGASGPAISTVAGQVFGSGSNPLGTLISGGDFLNRGGIAGLGGLFGGGGATVSTAAQMGAGLEGFLGSSGIFATSGGTSAGLLGAARAALPWVGGALAIASLLDNNKGGPKTIGGASDAATIQATVAATLAQFGVKSTGLRVGGFSAADPQGDSLTQLQTALFRGDTALYSRQDRLGGFENVGRSSEELAAAWAEETARITLAALKSSLEPKYQQYLREVDANTSSADAINAALARVTTARTLEERLLELSSTDAENLARARQRELDAMDATLRPLQQRLYTLQDEARITGKINGVMADYLSDTELRAARIWQIHQQLGKAGLDISLDRIASATRGDLRALYEEMVRIGDMGAAEALLDVAGAFAQITEPANQAADAVEDMARRLQDAGKGVWDYVRTLTATRAGTATPVDMLGGSRSNYLQDLALARAGDLDAYGRINSSAQAYIDAQKSYTASGGNTQAVISQIISELNSLPAVRSYEAQNLELLGQIAQATGATSTSTGGNKVTSDQILSRLMQDSLLSYSRAEAAAVYNAIASNTGTSASYLSNIAYHTQLMANQLISGVMNVRSEFRAGGLATFEAGGFHTGGLRLVGERGPELEVTGPARIYNAEQTRSMLAGSGGASAEEVRGLREDVRRLIAVVAAGANASVAQQSAIVTNTRRTAERAELMAARP